LGQTVGVKWLGFVDMQFPNGPKFDLWFTCAREVAAIPTTGKHVIATL